MANLVLFPVLFIFVIITAKLYVFSIDYIVPEKKNPKPVPIGKLYKNQSCKGK